MVVQDPFPIGLSEHVGGQHLIGRSGCHQTTVQHHHLVTVPGLVEVVGGQDDDATSVPLLADDAQDPLLADQVEARDRLVEEQEVCLTCQGLGHQDALTLPEGQAVQRSVQECPDAEASGRSIHRRVVRRPKTAGQEGGAEPRYAEDLADSQGHPGSGVALRHERHRRPVADDEAGGRCP